MNDGYLYWRGSQQRCCLHDCRCHTCDNSLCEWRLTSHVRSNVLYTGKNTKLLLRNIDHRWWAKRNFPLWKGSNLWKKNDINFSVFTIFTLFYTLPLLDSFSIKILCRFKPNHKFVFWARLVKMTGKKMTKLHIERWPNWSHYC